MKKLFNGIYRNKTILVTGHTGFKGSWLSIWLNELGAKVIGYSLDPYTNRDNFVLSCLKDKIVDIRDDIRNIGRLQDTFNRYNPEIVFHLAAQPIVRVSYDMPMETFDQNIMGTVNILEAVRKSSTANVCVCITTDKCYENKEWIWGYRENDRLGGYDPYSSSKAAAELVISSYRNSFFNVNAFDKHRKSISSARAGNVIGGGDWAKDRIVPDCIRALEGNQPINVRNPSAKRPWQYVLEPLGGYLLLASKMLENGSKYADAWNFGPDFQSVVDVKEVVDLIIQYWGSGNWKDTSELNINAVHEAGVLSLDCTKAKSYLKWSPSLSIEEAVKYTIEWFKDYPKGNVYDMCVKQIESYSNKCFYDSRIIP